MPSGSQSTALWGSCSSSFGRNQIKTARAVCVLQKFNFINEPQAVQVPAQLLAPTQQRKLQFKSLTTFWLILSSTFLFFFFGVWKLFDLTVLVLQIKMLKYGN